MSFLNINIQKIRYALALFKRAYSGYRIQILVTTILGFVSGLASGIGISMLIPLFSLVAGGDAIPGTDKLSKIVERIFKFLHFGYNLPFILALMVVLFIAKALISIISNYITEKITGQYMEDMRSLSLKKTLGASWPYLMNQKIGFVEKIISSDASYSASILRNISETVLRLTNLIAYTIIAFNISSRITVISLCGGILIFLFIKPIFYKTRKIFEFLNIADKETSHFINEGLIGIKTIKSFAVEPQMIDKSRLRFKELKTAQVKSTLLSNLQGILFEPVGLIFISFIFAFSYKTPGFNVASFAVIIYLIQKMFSFIQAIQGKLNIINGALPYLDTMLDYQESAGKNQEVYSGRQPFKFEKTISLEEVTFAYPETDDSVLSNVSFSIQKGEMLGIIGPSGSGKTTLVDTLLRLLTPQKGMISSDSIDINLIRLKDWRENLGYVSQDVFLVNDTIEENIRFYNHSVSHQDVISASKVANIYNFIRELPNQFDTLVGERGVKLSGGQKQRIALARALARKPSILILDEATSALDNESESLIQEAINGLKGKVTVLVIAHRLSTVMSSDSIIVLEKGKIVESGTPQELLKNQNSYLYKSYHLAEDK